MMLIQADSFQLVSATLIKHLEVNWKFIWAYGILNEVLLNRTL